MHLASNTVVSRLLCWCSCSRDLIRPTDNRYDASPVGFLLRARKRRGGSGDTSGYDALEDRTLHLYLDLKPSPETH